MSIISKDSKFILSTAGGEFVNKFIKSQYDSNKDYLKQIDDNPDSKQARLSDLDDKESLILKLAGVVLNAIVNGFLIWNPSKSIPKNIWPALSSILVSAGTCGKELVEYSKEQLESIDFLTGHGSNTDYQQLLKPYLKKLLEETPSSVVLSPKKSAPILDTCSV